MNILLLCIWGLSTSVLVRNMKAAAEKRGLTNVKVEYTSVTTYLPNQLEGYDVVLLGPQVRYMQEDVEKKAKNLRAQIGILSMEVYGLGDGDAALDQALALFEAGESSDKDQ